MSFLLRNHTVSWAQRKSYSQLPGLWKPIRLPLHRHVLPPLRPPRRFNSTGASFKPLFKKLFPYIGLLVLLDTAGIIYFFPQIQTIYSILSAPSASESLLSPSTSSLTNSIAQHIRTHPIAQALRADGSYTESRPHLRLPQPMRQHSLTAGVLAGPGRIVVPPLVFCDDLRGKLVSLAFLGEDLCGHPGIIHGGLSATLLDESMGRCGLAALPNRMGFTAQLTVNYRKPVKAGSYVVIKAEVVKTEGRKVWVTGRIEGLEDGEMEGEVLAEAEALFVQPRNTPVLSKLLTVLP